MPKTPPAAPPPFHPDLWDKLTEYRTFVAGFAAKHGLADTVPPAPGAAPVPVEPTPPFSLRFDPSAPAAPGSAWEVVRCDAPEHRTGEVLQRLYDDRQSVTLSFGHDDGGVDAWLGGDANGVPDVTGRTVPECVRLLADRVAAADPAGAFAAWWREAGKVGV